MPVWDDGPEITGKPASEHAPEGATVEPPPDDPEATGHVPLDEEAEITGELRVSGPPQAPQPEGETRAPDAPAAAAPTSEPVAHSHLVPLSDIIVTTSSKMVDLQDPDVRRMLTELVTFEIDQAADFRRRGQTIDAVLQLTEAEKVSRALGMTESAQRIRAMMREIHDQD
jgi:hypothetical protein